MMSTALKLQSSSVWTSSRRCVQGLLREHAAASVRSLPEEAKKAVMNAYQRFRSLVQTHIRWHQRDIALSSGTGAGDTAEATSSPSPASSDPVDVLEDSDGAAGHFEDLYDPGAVDFSAAAGRVIETTIDRTSASAEIGTAFLAGSISADEYHSALEAIGEEGVGASAPETPADEDSSESGNDDLSLAEDDDAASSDDEESVDDMDEDVPLDEHQRPLMDHVRLSGPFDPAMAFVKTSLEQDAPLDFFELFQMLVDTPFETFIDCIMRSAMLRSSSA